MHWYLVYTKPRQEKCALQNLEQQGYECYLPTISRQQRRPGGIAAIEESLFPRYLFIRLGQGGTAKSWAPVRSTKGVSQLVRFGAQPACVADDLIERLREQACIASRTPMPLFERGDRVHVTDGAFAGVEGIFQMTDGDHRVMVLIELLSRSVPMRVHTADLRRVS